MTAGHVGAITAALVVIAVGASTGQAQTYRTVGKSRLAQGEQDLRVRVEFAVGSFQLEPEPRGALYRARLVYDAERFEPTVDYDPADRTLRIELTGHDRRARLEELTNTKQRLHLSLGRAVPTSLELRFGATAADLDLGGLSLVDVSIHTGASRTTVRFSEPNAVPCRSLEFEAGAAEFTAEKLGNARCERLSFAGGAGEVVLDFGGAWGSQAILRASVKIGLGAVTLRLPRDLGVTVELNRLLVGFDRAGFVKRGSRYVSTNYERSAARLHLKVDAVIGDINVEWY